MPIVTEEQRIVNESSPVQEPLGGWDVQISDTQTGEVWLIWTGLTKAQMLKRLRLWDEAKTECVLMPWPANLPRPKIS